MSKKHFVTSHFASNDDKMLIVTEKSTGNKLVSQIFNIEFLFAVIQQNGLLGFFARRYLIGEICIAIKRDLQKLSQKLTLHFMQQGYRVLKLAFPKHLKELRNCIPRIVSVWSLFFSIWVYKSLQFLPILLGN